MRLLKDWRKCLDETDLEMAATTKFHAMRRWFVSGAVVRRTMWGILACFALAVWVYLMSERVQTFQEYQLKTSVSSQYVRSMQFPAVTICNFNMLSDSALTKADKNLLKDVSFAFATQLRQLISSKKEAASNTSVADNTELNNQARRLYLKYAEMERVLMASEYHGQPVDITGYIGGKGWQLDDSNLRCYFGTDACSSENFTTTLTRFGKCYTFNNDESNALNQVVPGKLGGLRLYLNINEDDYYPYEILGEIQKMAGAKIIIHQPFEPPILNTGLSAMPGYEMNVPLKLQVLTTINNPPWNQCGDGPIGAYSQYSVPGCLAVCQSQAYTSSPECGCLPWYLPPAAVSSFPTCSISQSIYCSLWAINETYRQSCSRNCLEACATNQFTFDSGYAKLLGIPAASQLGLSADSSKYSLSFIENNWLQISVYFPLFVYDKADSSIAYPYDALLADFGNYFSMFIGFSVVTMFDLIEYPFLKIYRQCIRPAVAKRNAQRLKKRRRDPIATVTGYVDNKDQKTVDKWTKEAIEKQRQRDLEFEDEFSQPGFIRRGKPHVRRSSIEPAKFRTHGHRGSITSQPQPYRKRALTNPSSVSAIDRDTGALSLSFKFLKRSFSIGRS